MSRVVIIVMMLLAACGDGTAAVVAAPEEPFSCPVTIPDAPGFLPPPSHPAVPSVPDAVWYGSDDLWTVLELDGVITPRKSVWWSANFPGGGVESKPDVEVTYERLDIEAPLVTQGGPGTNAATAEDGWFMIAGADPADSGCWQVTATYKGAALSYVYER